MSDSRKPKILVVDDDGFAREMFGSILESFNYEVETADSGKDALAKYIESPDYDLILSDMNMPKMSGLDFIREFRKTNSDTPIVILTVNDDIGTALDAIRSGADDYLLKDENIPQTLIFSVEQALEKYQLLKQNRLLMEELVQKNKELDRKNKELERLSSLDGLTGVANRRHFNNVIEQEWNRSIREGDPISLIMIDIDFFKLFNDTYGHLQGDDCLKKVAVALDNALRRPGDELFRYGGEEFIAILPNTNLNGANVVAEIMRENVLALKIPHARSQVSQHITVSIGLGGVIPKRNSNYMELIDVVDQALYLAKQEGRNRIKKACS